MSKHNKRSLKIEATGDFFKRQVTSKIRLSGKWLERAGFLPGQRAAVTVEDRIIILRAEGSDSTPEKTYVINQL